MSLRLRLFLLLAALVVLLVGTQAVLVRHLARRLDQDVRTVAFRVGEEILSGFTWTSGDGGDEPPPQERTHVVVFGAPVAAPAATPGEPGAPAPAAGEAAAHFRWLVHHETTVEHDERLAAGGKLERRLDLEVDADGTAAPEDATQPAASGGAAAPPARVTERVIKRLVLEPGEEPDVLFLRGPAAAARPIQIPRAEVSSTLDRFRSQLLAGALGIAALGLVAAALAADRIARPLRDLAGAARRVGAGELGVEVPVARGGAARHARDPRDEIGVAVDAFNRMSRHLVALDAENRRLAESERLSELSEVARGLAHTLRNPLNALGLSVDELAARASDAAGAADLVESSRRQIRRIDGALRSFLALASAGAAAAERVDLAMLARETVLEALQDAAGRVRIELALPAAAVEIVAVPAEVKTVLQALVVNAVEASPDGGRVDVELVARAGGGARIQVVDAGPGLPDEVVARLFEPHVTTKPHGSGMGLFLAHRIAVGRYGGTLALAAAAPGPGTRATLELGDRAGGGA